jgi:hypothetical protein
VRTLTEQTETKRELLEKEVRITARESKSIDFCGRAVLIKALPWKVMEDIGDVLIRIFKPLFEIAAKGSSPSPTELISVDSLSGMAGGSKELVRALVLNGTNVTSEEMDGYDFDAVLLLALEVLKYNLGPQLRKNLLTGGAVELMETFGVKLKTLHVPSTGSSLDSGDKGTHKKN